MTEYVSDADEVERLKVVVNDLLDGLTNLYDWTLLAIPDAHKVEAVQDARYLIEGKS